MNKFKLGFATVSMAAMAGGISLASVSPDFLASANAQLANLDIEPEEERVIDSSETESLEAGGVDAIATTYSHDLSGREAVTVYVKNIPVATFLESVQSDDSSEPTKVASTSDTLDVDQSDVVSPSEEFVSTINQFGQDKVNAEKIGVKWDKAKELYVIHLDQTPLIAMDGNVMLPTTTKDDAEDALQITNRLRRQIGNVKPLKQIEGQPPKKVAVAPTNVSRYQDGWASWYGPGFHGNLTADGSRYNQYGLTAAHRTLPFGTKLRVTNRNNGRSVIVTVNDRGPFIYDRVIDLSMGAAQALGVVNTGVAPVSLDIVN